MRVIMILKRVSEAFRPGAQNSVALVGSALEFSLLVQQQKRR